MLLFLQGGHRGGGRTEDDGSRGCRELQTIFETLAKPVEHIEAADQCVLASGALPLLK